MDPSCMSIYYFIYLYLGLIFVAIYTFYD